MRNPGRLGSEFPKREDETTGKKTQAGCRLVDQGSTK